MESPRKLYGDDYVSNAFAQLRLSFKQVRNNLEDARRHREDYFNRRTTDRAFCVGKQVLVKFPKIPIGVNPKFYKIWRGPYTVVKVLSRLNLKLQAGAYGKTIVVHVDRVKHMNLHDEGVIFDANRNALSLNTPNPIPPSGTFKANERDSTVNICVSVDPDLQDNVSVRYHSPDETFSCLLYTSPSPRDRQKSRMPSSA